MSQNTNKNTKFKVAFWSIFVVFIADLIVIIPSFFDFNTYWWMSLTAVLILDGLLTGLVLYGNLRYEKVKNKGKETTTFSRKMFNIVASLLASVFIFLFDPLFSIFCLITLDWAFGMHEVVYAGLKLKMWYTDAFNALGRQSEEYKPYYASFMALLSSTLVLGVEAPILFFYQNLFLPLTFKWTVFYIYTTSVMIWGIGDTSAFLAGSKYGKHKLPWNKNKSLEGLIANILVSIAVTFVFIGLGFFINGIITTSIYITLVIITGTLGAFYESLDLKLDDNLTTPLLTGITLTLLIIFLLIIL